MKQLALVVLRKKLFENEKSKYTTPGNYLETDTRHTDLSLILLSLFVL